MNNPVSKYDFNKGGWHRDHKNDYDRLELKRDLEKDLDEIDEIRSCSEEEEDNEND